MTLRELAWRVDGALHQRWQEASFVASAVLTCHSNQPVPPHKINPYRSPWARQTEPDIGDVFEVED